MSEQKFQVSWFLRVNQYPGTCACCGEAVAAGDGFAQKNRASGKWETVCDACVRKFGRVTPKAYRYGGEIRVAGAKSVVTGRRHDALECNTCGATVAFVKGKSGKFYLANVYAKVKMEADSPDGLRVYDFRSHDCEPFLRRRAEQREQSEQLEREQVEREERFAEMERGVLAEIPTMTDEQLASCLRSFEVMSRGETLAAAIRSEQERRSS